MTKGKSVLYPSLGEGALILLMGAIALAARRPLKHVQGVCVGALGRFGQNDVIDEHAFFSSLTPNT